jgi:outer membrane autotransporter protein
MNTAIFGSSDLNYSYTFGPAYHFAGDVNGAVQSPNSRLWVDTFLGGPGATSDRLVFSGNASGSTRILVNDVNAGAGSFNPVGITVVALGGSSNGSNFVVDPLSKNWVNFGPLGAIDKGFFLYPLGQCK